MAIEVGANGRPLNTPSPDEATELISLRLLEEAGDAGPPADAFVARALPQAPKPQAISLWNFLKGTGNA